MHVSARFLPVAQGVLYNEDPVFSETWLGTTQSRDVSCHEAGQGQTDLL